MAVTVTHQKVSGVADSGDTTLVQPSDWNATHTLSGLGSGVETALGIAVGSAGGPVVNGGALGTPSSGTLTNATGLPLTGTTGTLGETRGGTGQTTFATGDILYASGANTLAKLAAGTNTHVLTLSGGVPTWAAPSGGGGSPGGSDTQVQFNDGGAFGGVSGFTFNKTDKTLSIASASAKYAIDITSSGVNQPGIRIVNGVDTLEIGSDNQYRCAIRTTYGLSLFLGDQLTLGGQAAGTGIPSLGDQNGLNITRRGIFFARHATASGTTPAYGPALIAIDAQISDDNTADLELRAQTAYTSATTNIDGGNIVLKGGNGASASAGDADGGHVYLDGGQGYGTGSHGDVIVGNTRGNLVATLKGTKEVVYTITDGAAFEIDPANGGIQIITLGANRTPAATNFTAGQSVTLMIADGTAYTITWSTVAVTWVGGAAPTLATSGYTVVELWKVGSTIYGAHVGDVA